jgi:uncharacterized protein YtpQ (UPF0354 family)
MKAYKQTLNFVNTLNLKGIGNSLDEIINDAEIKKDSYITFLIHYLLLKYLTG